MDESGGWRSVELDCDVSGPGHGGTGRLQFLGPLAAPFKFVRSVQYLPS
jgi:hypothetical protein